MRILSRQMLLAAGAVVYTILYINIYYKLYNCINEYRYAKTRITENNMVANNVNYISNRYTKLSRYGNKWLCPCHLLYYNIKV